MNWRDRIQVRKGFIGEGLIKEYLETQGYIIYAPETEGAHPFDRLVASQDKKTVFVAEIKAKARRKYYPDTGINATSYQDYINIQKKYRMSVFIFFVDEIEQKIYGNFLTELARPETVLVSAQAVQYPLKQKTKWNEEIIYFPLSHMKTIGTLTRQDADGLMQLSTRNPDYNE